MPATVKFKGRERLYRAIIGYGVPQLIPSTDRLEIILKLPPLFRDDKDMQRILKP